MVLWEFFEVVSFWVVLCPGFLVVFCCVVVGVVFVVCPGVGPDLLGWVFLWVVFWFLCVVPGSDVVFCLVWVFFPVDDLVEDPVAFLVVFVV